MLNTVIFYTGTWPPVQFVPHLIKWGLAELLCTAAVLQAKKRKMIKEGEKEATLGETVNECKYIQTILPVVLCGCVYMWFYAHLNLMSFSLMHFKAI